MNDTTRELGGAPGVAILGSLVTSTSSSSIADAIRGLGGADQALARSGLTGAMQAAQHVGAGGQAIVDSAKQAFVDGLGSAAIVGSVVVALASVLAYRLLPKTHSAMGTDAPPVDIEDGDEEREPALV
jgi:hypothetical protein